MLTQNNQFLFVLNNGDGVIQGFRVLDNGHIFRNGRPASVPTSVTGLVSR